MSTAEQGHVNPIQENVSEIKKSKHPPVASSSSKLYDALSIDIDDSVEIKLCQHHQALMSQTGYMNEHDTAIYLQNKSTLSQDAYKETIDALVYGIITVDSSQMEKRSMYIRFLSMIIRDEYHYLSSTLKYFFSTRFSALRPSTRQQLVYICGHLFQQNVKDMAPLFVLVLRHLRNGRMSVQHRITYVEDVVHLIDMLLTHQLLKHYPDIIPMLLVSSLRLVLDFHAILTSLVSNEVHPLLDLVVASRLKLVTMLQFLLQQYLIDCLVVGRDLVRLIQDVSLVPGLEDICRRIFYSPDRLIRRKAIENLETKNQSIKQAHGAGRHPPSRSASVPSTDIIQSVFEANKNEADTNYLLAYLLRHPTPKRFLMLLISPELGACVQFLLDKVRLGQQRRYFQWMLHGYFHPCIPNTTGSSPSSSSSIQSSSSSSTSLELFDPKLCNDILVADAVRYLVRCIHPPNAQLQSENIQRWALADWFIRIATTLQGVGMTKLALFYDWLFFSSQLDNVMNIEPGILTIYHSISKYPDMSSSLVEFLLLAQKNYIMKSPIMSSIVNDITTSIQAALECILVKGVVANVDFLFKGEPSSSGGISLALQHAVRQQFGEGIVKVYSAMQAVKKQKKGVKKTFEKNDENISMPSALKAEAGNSTMSKASESVASGNRETSYLSPAVSTFGSSMQMPEENFTTISGLQNEAISIEARQNLTNKRQLSMASGDSSVSKKEKRNAIDKSVKETQTPVLRFGYATISQTIEEFLTRSVFDECRGYLDTDEKSEGINSKTLLSVCCMPIKSQERIGNIRVDIWYIALRYLQLILNETINTVPTLRSSSEFASKCLCLTVIFEQRNECTNELIVLWRQLSQHLSTILNLSRDQIVCLDNFSRSLGYSLLFFNQSLYRELIGSDKIHVEKDVKIEGHLEQQAFQSVIVSLFKDWIRNSAEITRMLISVLDPAFLNHIHCLLLSNALQMFTLHQELIEMFLVVVQWSSTEQRYFWLLLGVHLDVFDYPDDSRLGFLLLFFENRCFNEIASHPIAVDGIIMVFCKCLPPSRFHRGVPSPILSDLMNSILYFPKQLRQLVSSILMYMTIHAKGKVGFTNTWKRVLRSFSDKKDATVLSHLLEWNNTLKSIDRTQQDPWLVDLLNEIVSLS